MSIVQIVTLDITQMFTIISKDKKNQNEQKDSWDSYTANWFCNYRKGTTSL